jgi:8-oxo-dGTP diphosphatase
MALEDYPRPSVTADVVVLALWDSDLHILLIVRRSPPFQGAWALPGGFVGIDEPLDRAAERELAEETGLRHVHLEQVRAFGDPGRDPRGRVITVAYLALVPYNAVTPRAGSDAARAKWWPVSGLPSLAFDHVDIIDTALGRLRQKIRCGMLPVDLLPESFTREELDGVHEAVLGEAVDSDDLWRKMLDGGLVLETGEVRTAEDGDAKLYRFQESARAAARMSGLATS